jgi:hypothetical protein
MGQEEPASKNLNRFNVAWRKYRPPTVDPSLEHSVGAPRRSCKSAAPVRLDSGQSPAYLEQHGLARPSKIQPCLPSPAKQPPSGPGWIHEIKHDGFRIIARLDRESVRLYSRKGNDLSHRCPLIRMAVALPPARSCLIDGEAIVCNEAELAVFALIRGHSDGGRFEASVFGYHELVSVAQNLSTGRQVLRRRQFNSLDYRRIIVSRLVHACRDRPPAYGRCRKRSHQIAWAWFIAEPTGVIGRC